MEGEWGRGNSGEVEKGTRGKRIPGVERENKP